MSIKINAPTAMNMPQHYSRREKSVRTLTIITPCKAMAAARGRENQPHPQNSVGVQHLSFMLRLSQKAKNLTARDAKGLRKERNVFILMHLFFATFAKDLSIFAVKRLLRQAQIWHSRLRHSKLRLSPCMELSTLYAYGVCSELKNIKIQ